MIENSGLWVVWKIWGPASSTLDVESLNFFRNRYLKIFSQLETYLGGKKKKPVQDHFQTIDQNSSTYSLAWNPETLREQRQESNNQILPSKLPDRTSISDMPWETRLTSTEQKIEKRAKIVSLKIYFSRSYSYISLQIMLWFSCSLQYWPAHNFFYRNRQNHKFWFLHQQAWFLTTCLILSYHKMRSKEKLKQLEKFSEHITASNLKDSIVEFASLFWEIQRLKSTTTS